MIVIVPQNAKDMAVDIFDKSFRSADEKQTAIPDTSVATNISRIKGSLPNLKNNPWGILSILICMENIIKENAMKADPMSAPPKVVRIVTRLSMLY
jgi:hypothetical protein